MCLEVGIITNLSTTVLEYFLITYEYIYLFANRLMVALELIEE